MLKRGADFFSGLDLKTKLDRCIFLIGCCGFLILGGCVANPATGNRDFTPLMTPEKAAAIGAQEHRRVIAKYGVYNDPDLGAYVAQLGGKLAAQSELADQPFQFTVLDSPTVNAFALPGGYIYVTRGLLALANSEAELASVLGHEIGHVTARHSATRYQRAASSGLLSQVVGSVLGSGAGQLVKLAGDSYVASYSRDQEYQADALGLRYTSRANYDPRAAGDFLAAMRSIESQQSHNARGFLGDLFASHPNTAERVAKAKALAKTKLVSQPQLAHGRVGRRTLLQQLDGLPYGNSLSRGIIAKQTYLHRNRRVTIRVPGNLRGQVTDQGLVAKDNTGLFLNMDIGPQRRTSDPFRYLTTDWGRNFNLRDAGRVNVNGLTAAAAWTKIKRRGQVYQVFLAAINTGPGQFYRLLLANPQESNGQLFRQWLHSFRRLSADEARRLRVPRIRLHRVKAGETVAQLARLMANPKTGARLIRILNQIPPGSQPRAGRLIKLVSVR